VVVRVVVVRGHHPRDVRHGPGRTRRPRPAKARPNPSRTGSTPARSIHRR